MTLLDIFTFLVFFLVILLVYVIRAFSSKQRQAETIAQRMAQLHDYVDPQHVVSQGDLSILNEKQEIVGSAWPVIGDAVKKIHDNMMLLGWQHKMRLRIMLMILVSVVIGFMIGVRSPSPMLVGSATALVLFIAIGVVSYRSAMQKYLEQLQVSLPEAIDNITRTCRAGVPLQSAFAIAAESLRSPLAAELKLVDQWLRLGIPLRSALIDSAKRVPIPEYRFFAVIMIINQETGGRLGDTMDRLSATLRARAEMKMKVMAKTSEARASAKIVASLVPAVLAYMYVNAPEDFMFLLNDPTGKVVFTYALCSVGLGLFITHLLVKKVA